MIDHQVGDESHAAAYTDTHNQRDKTFVVVAHVRRETIGSGPTGTLRGIECQVEPARYHNEQRIADHEQREQHGSRHFRAAGEGHLDGERASLLYNGNKFSTDFLYSHKHGLLTLRRTKMLCTLWRMARCTRWQPMRYAAAVRIRIVSGWEPIILSLKTIS